MPISKQEADHLVDVRKAMEIAIYARLEQLSASLRQEWESDPARGDLSLDELLSIARAIDYSMLCRSHAIDMEYGYTLYAEVLGNISSEMEEFLAEKYETAGWLLLCYPDKRGHGVGYTEVRGFDIGEKEEYLLEQAEEEQRGLA